MNDVENVDERLPSERPLMIHEGMLATEGAPASRIDFERGMSRLPPLTLGLILFCVAVFLWQLGSGALAGPEALIEAGALVRQRVLDGEVWRLLSATFLHAGLDHLLGNCMILYIVGMACEHAFGWKRAGLIYVASALGGSLLSTALQPGPSVGASGAVFGVAGAVVAFFFRRHDAIVLRDKRIGFVLLLWALYQIGTGLLNPWIDNCAHIGGFLSGVALALVLSPRLLAPPEPDAWDLSA